ncbi:MAG: hypothetical protein GXY83_26165 [Rhodopirellula sp.]|nr:hypothetical protein [Rhodopirellula sp.]
MTERIIIEGRTARLSNGDGTGCEADVEAWVRQINRFSVAGRGVEPIPDNVKWIVSCGGTEVFIVELKPELRRILWISEDSPAPFGPEAKATAHRLATPYVVLKIPFRRGRIVPRVEVFYRNEPLARIDGPGGALYWPNLLNVSPNAHDCTSWFCTQYLAAEPIRGGRAGALSAVVHHLWGGHFNRSSEFHEGQSAFGKAALDGVDPRVTDVKRWEAESVRDPRFILSIPWRATELDVSKLIDLELCAQGIAAQAPGSVSELANPLMRAARPAAKTR